MANKRRYGTTKPGKLALTQDAVKGPTGAPKRMPLLVGERREIRLPSSYGAAGSDDASADRRSSEREPLLVDSRDGNKRSLGNSGIGDSDAGTAAFGAGSSRRDNGRLLTSLLLLNYMIGSGILNAPQVFEGSGIGIATVMYIVSGVATWWGVHVLILAAEKVFSRGAPLSAVRGGRRDSSGAAMAATGVWGEEGGGGAAVAAEAEGRLPDVEYTQLARETLGPVGALTLDLSIVVQCFGDVSSYIILIGSLTTSLILEWGGEAVSSAWWATFSFVAPIMVACFVFPPSLIRHLSNLRYLAIFSFCAISSVVLLVVIGGPIYARAERSVPNHNPELDAAVVLWDWSGCLSQLGSIIFAVSFAPGVLQAYTAMTPRTVEAWTWVGGSTVVIGCCMCYAMGLGGYLSFRDAVDGDILNNFSGTLASVFKAVVVAHLVIYTPTEVIIVRHSLYQLKGREVMLDSFARVACVTFVFLALAVGLVVGLEAADVAEGDLFGYILDITGGVAMSVSSFILPGLIYLAATSEDGFCLWDSEGGRDGLRNSRRSCKALVIFGFVVMVVVPVGVIADLAGW